MRFFLFTLCLLPVLSERSAAVRLDAAIPGFQDARPRKTGAGQARGGGGRIGVLVDALGASEADRRVGAEETLAAELSRASTESRSRYEAVLRDLKASLEDGASLAARRRLSVLLGGDDRAFGFAVDLASDGSLRLRGVGEAALIAQLERWSLTAMAEPSIAAYDIPRQALTLPRPLKDSAGSQLALDPNGNPPEGLASAPAAAAFVSGAVAFDLLDRRGGAPLPIVLDPAFVERMARRPARRLGAARIDGRWPDVLEQLCAIHDGAFQLQGYRFPDESHPADEARMGVSPPPPRPWIHVVQRGTTELAPVGRDLRERGAERIVEWTRGVVREGNLVRQSASARALATLGVPAAIGWLERRWSWYGDLNALEGLMAAAARGRVAATLQSPAAVRAILALVERSAQGLVPLKAARSVALADETKAATGLAYQSAASALDARLRRIALGMRELLPVLVDPSSEGGLLSLDSVLFEGFGDASREGQWLRLAAAEGLGVPSELAGAAARAILEDARPPGDGPSGRGPGGALRRQALRTLAVVRASKAPVRLARVEELFALAGSNARDLRGLGAELGRVEPIQLVRSVSFPSPELLRSRGALTELLVWAGLGSGQSRPGRGEGQRSGASAADAWIERVLSAAVQEWLAARTPDLRETERAALAAAARQLRRLGGVPLTGLGSGGPGSGGPGSRSLLDRADRAVIESVALREGGVSAQARSEALERAVNLLKRSADEPAAVQRAWLDLAALSGDRDLGGRARRTLLDSVIAAMGKGPRRPAASSTVLIYAVESAFSALRSARLEPESVEFRITLQKAAQAADHPLGDRFLQLDWPPAPRSGVRDLEGAEPIRPPVDLFL